jgi:Carboxypeptidase regulatory-like domain
VTASSLDNRAVRSTQTNASGLYAIPQLRPGRYELRAERSGFQTLMGNEVNLITGETANIDFSLQLGATNVTVNVAARTELLDTAGSSLSTVVQGTQVEQMPLNGRNVLNLVTLVPGVIPQGSSQGSPVGNQNGGAFSQPGGIGNYQIGGGFAGQSVIHIDGAPDNMLLQNN